MTTPGMLKSLGHSVLQQCVRGVFGWEGRSPDRTLLTPEVLSSLAKFYAGVLDDIVLAGELESPALRLLSEFLTEPSVSTLGAMVDAIPPKGRMFRQPRGRPRPASDSSWSSEERRARACMRLEESLCGHTDEVLEFIRKHEFRSATVMLTRCGGHSHTAIVTKFGISRSRSYRYEKWFEGLPDVNKTGIIVLGGAICERYEASAGPDEPRLMPLDFVTRTIQSPDALGLLEGARGI